MCNYNYTIMVMFYSIIHCEYQTNAKVQDLDITDFLKDIVVSNWYSKMRLACKAK